MAETPTETPVTAGIVCGCHVQEQYGSSAAITYDLDLCHNMLCRQPGASECRGTLAFDGTTCGNQKVLFVCLFHCLTSS